MRSRVVLLAAAFLVAVPISASAAPVCKLVEDKAGDASPSSLTSSVIDYKALDIRSFDVATGKKSLVVVLRLASTNKADHQVTDTAGLTWTATFRINDTDHRFTRKLNGSGQATDTATSGGQAINGVKVAVTQDAVTWTVPRGNVPSLRKAGATITGFYASASTTGGTDQAPDDGRGSGKVYKDKQASCVRAA